MLAGSFNSNFGVRSRRYKPSDERTASIEKQFEKDFLRQINLDKGIQPSVNSMNKLGNVPAFEPMAKEKPRPRFLQEDERDEFESCKVDLKKAINDVSRRKRSAIRFLEERQLDPEKLHGEGSLGALGKEVLESGKVELDRESEFKPRRNKGNAQASVKAEEPIFLNDSEKDSDFILNKIEIEKKAVRPRPNKGKAREEYSFKEY